MPVQGGDIWTLDLSDEKVHRKWVLNVELASGPNVPRQEEAWWVWALVEAPCAEEAGRPWNYKSRWGQIVKEPCEGVQTLPEGTIKQLKSWHLSSMWKLGREDRGVQEWKQDLSIRRVLQSSRKNINEVAESVMWFGDRIIWICWWIRWEKAA